MERLEDLEFAFFYLRGLSTDRPSYLAFGSDL